jgi:hypothetical protein
VHINKAYKTAIDDYELVTKAIEATSSVDDKYRYAEITRLEKNDSLVYESVPGTAVTNLKYSGDEVSFCVEGKEDADITLGLAEETAYEIIVNGESAGVMTTNLGGKLSFGVELSEGVPTGIDVKLK